MTNASGAPSPSLATLLVRRTTIAVVLVLVLLVPAVVMLIATAVVTGHAEPAATWAAIPAVAGIAAVAVGGVELGLQTAVVLGLLGPLTVVAGGSPVSGAALMGIMCLMVGRMSRFGLQRAGLLVPVMVAWPLISPPAWGVPPVVTRTDTAFLLWMGAIFFVGAVFPVLVCPFLLRKAHLPAPRPHPRSEALPYTVMITLLTMVSTFYVLDHPKMYGGAFLIAAILVLAPIGEADVLRPTLIRVAGTLLGSLLVLVVIADAKSLALVYALGLVFGVAAVASKFGKRAWVYYVLMVPTTACLNAYALPQVGQLGEQRVVDNLVGGALVLIASALSIGYARWEASRGNSTTTHDVIAGEPVVAPA
jgi:hypothetical protein